MKNLVLVSTVLLALGCGNVDDNVDGGTAGSDGDSGMGATPGSGGTGGTGASAGAGGSGGTPGAGGSGAAGASGTGGTGGSAGTSGTGGAGATGGSAGFGGTGGAGASAGTGGTGGTGGLAGSGGVAGVAGGGGVGGTSGVAGGGGNGGVAGGNACPVIESLTADTNPIPNGEDTTTVRVAATDSDAAPEPLATEFSSTGGVFEDRFATVTNFTCGEPGPVEISVEATDGDSDCDQTSNLIIQCPLDIQPNICPMLFIINAIPRTILPGNTTTWIETRAQDTDAQPSPLVLTLRALWGSFENEENIPGENNQVSQDATYICDRPGPVEICVDATDGACTKTQCDIVTCPDDIPAP